MYEHLHEFKTEAASFYANRKEVHVQSIREVVFDSFADLTAAKPKHALNRGHSWGLGSKFSLDWFGAESEAALDSNVANGWDSVNRKVRDLLGEIKLPEAMTRPELHRRRKRTRGDFGNELDVHRVYQGDLNKAWDRTRKVEVSKQQSKLVHIVAKVGSAGYVTHAQALWRAAVIIRIHEALVRMGKSVAITVFDAGMRGLVDGGTWMVSCRVKEYGQTLDERKLAAMSTVGFGRWYLMERGTACCSVEPTGGKGSDVDNYQCIPHSAKEEQERSGGAVVMIGNCYSQHDADQVISKFVAQFTTGEKVQGGVL